MKRRMSTASIILIFLLLIGWLVIMNYQSEILDFLMDKFYKKDIVVVEENEYYRDYDFNFAQNTDNFYPTNKKELYNVFYTILNKGWDSFTFYCDDTYLTCINDVETLTQDKDALSDFNNYVHPFNNYSVISVDYNTLGRVTVNVNKLYNNDEIAIINTKIDEIYKSIIKSNMSDTEKIKTVHDYIINNTKYDTEKSTLTSSDSKIIKYKYDSNKATGPLIYGVAICGGYTDLMELFLEKMNIKSYKISSPNHIWNYIYVNGSWKHLDITWDNPVTSNNQKILSDTFFLIDTDQLLKIDNTEHNFDRTTFATD